MRTVQQDWSWATGHPTAAALCAAAALAAAWIAYRLARKAGRAVRALTDGTEGAGPGADLFIIAAALLAQAVVLNGMWGFAGQVLHFGGIERASLFAFLDVAIIACAVRARRNMRKFGHAGIEGTAVWVLSAMSGVFSAMAAASPGAAAFRLSAPLVAAWLWHRAMSLEYQERTGKTTHWRLTAERVLIKLRLADPQARETTEVAAYARLVQLARCAKKLRSLKAAGAKPWRQGRALRRLENALSAAVEHAGLAADPGRQGLLRDLIGALTAAGSLAELDVAPPWDRAIVPARTTAELFSEMARTITPVPETPDPGPDRPLPVAPAIPVPPDIEALLREWARPALPAPDKAAPDKAAPDKAAPDKPAPDKAAEAARLRITRPDMTQADIARELNVTDRTVRRWLSQLAETKVLAAANGHSARQGEGSS